MSKSETSPFQKFAKLTLKSAVDTAAGYVEKKANATGRNSGIDLTIAKASKKLLSN